MLLTLALALFGGDPTAADTARAAAAGPAPAGHAAHRGAAFDGRAGRLDVTIPRLQADPVVDGVLDEAPWRDAAVLTGFSRYAPVDGVPAADSTHVLVWYSPTAIHFGIEAFDPGPVRANVAERDRIFADDNVELLLGTYNDARQALVFAVNPLGAQADGVLVESGQNRNSAGREPVDLSPDFVFRSKGRLTPWGWQAEVSIPFKSLRYTAGERQTWQLQVVRRTQRTGYEDSWAPVSRGAASFLVQAGHLVALTDLRRGIVLDLVPTVTQRVTGSARAAGWDYWSRPVELGGSVRWGITNNLSLNGTVKPDFSQVESDAGQFGFDPRQALFFPERRPFFLEGSEQFTVPNGLIYTRRIVQPDAAVKLAGKAFGTDVGVLSAVDQRLAPEDGGTHPVVNILRVQRDVGRQSRLGLVWTDRVAGGDWNRVGGVDGRLVMGGIYALQFQGALAADHRAGATTTAPLWEVRGLRNGRRLALRWRLLGIDEDFRTRSGFIGRPGIVNLNGLTTYTFFGKPGAFVEAVTPLIRTDVTWKYRAFTAGEASQDRKIHFEGDARLRGGWSVGGGVLVESFGYDPDIYANYRLQRTNPDGSTELLPFTGTPRLPNLDWVVRGSTPQFRSFSANFFFLWGRDENFYEWASGNILFGNLAVTVRPVPQAQLTGTWNVQRVARPGDGSEVALQHIPRLTLQYQPTPSFFVRFIGEYALDRSSALRDDSRTGLPIVFVDPATGAVTPAAAARSERFRGDLLLSYLPNPGTVVYVGYGSTFRAPDAIADPRLRRTADGFFLKLSYLFRV